MALSFHGFLFGCFAYLVTCITNYNVIAGLPSKRVSREIYPEIESDNYTNQSGVCIVGDVVYNIDEVVPAEQPCLKCKCKPPEVQCKALRCSDKKPGCKVVHKANMCCPDYQCDCEYNGKRYSNGERLQISPDDKCKVCYCRGGEIQCADVSCYVRNDCEGKRVAGQCCLKYDHCPTRDSLEKLQTNINSMNGTLPNNENVELRPSNEPESNNFHTQNDEGKENQTQPCVETDYPKITIQEIISGVREIPVSSDKNYESSSGTDSNKMVDVQFGGDKSNDVFEVDSDAEPSEISEVIESSPSVIRIGENLFLLGKDELVNEKDAGVTPSSIITLIGAEGLQQGGIEEMVYNETSLLPQPSSTISPSTSTTYVNNMDLNSASSTHILSLVKKKKKGNLTPTSTVRATSLSTESSTFIELENRKTDNATEFEYVSQKSNTPEDSVSSSPTSDISTAPYHVEIREIRINDKANSSEGELYELQGENLTTSSPISPGKLGKSNDDGFVSLIDLRAALPDEILNVQLDEFDEDVDENKKNTETENVTRTLSSENPEFETVDFSRSTETMENSQEYSGEKTTPSTTDSKPVISDENASIDNEKEKVSEANDMLAEEKPSPDLSHDEAKTKPDEKKTRREDFDADSVEILETTESQNVSTTDILQIKPAKIENLAKNIHKRENPVLSEDDSIFAQLNQELGLGTSEKLKTAEEEDNEARKIFQELLEETSTKTPQRKEARSKENESLERITQALAKLALRGSQPIDISALGVIRDFFSSQYRSYDTKTA